MSKIIRDPATAATQTHDLIIVGGGIYGAMLSLTAAMSGLRPLLLERGDFGGETSYNSLRILHGGLRYLQTLDLPRFFESVGERHWFLRTFPALTETLSCLMPLYGDGARKPPILKVALTLNDLLSVTRNQDVKPERQLPNGQVITSQQVQDGFGQVDTEGLQGGAIWYDGGMPDSQRVVISVLQWATQLGATVLNYVEAKELKTAQGKVTGVVGQDQVSGTVYEYSSNVVINAAGPWCRELATQFDQDVPHLFRSSIAWNALFDRPAIADHALAIAPKKPNARTYFLRPWKGRFLLGTVHDPWLDPVQSKPMPTDEQLQACIDDLNMAIPDLNLSSQEIVRIFSGLLPAAEEGTDKLAKREVILDHSKQGNVAGLYSVSGVKFTTSRLVAEKTLKMVFPSCDRKLQATAKQTVPAEVIQKRGDFSYDWMPEANDTEWLTEMWQIIQDEAVVHLDDLVLRRTSIGDNPERAMQVAPRLCELFGWDFARTQVELGNLQAYFEAVNPQPAKVAVET